jgi:hypothetical protein
MLLQDSTILPCGTTQFVSSNLVIALLDQDIRKTTALFFSGARPTGTGLIMV